MANTKAPHHRGAHQQIAKAIKAWGDSHPQARCAKCNNTLDKCGPRRDGRNRNGTPCSWDAGHAIDGDPTAGYQLECSFCNRSTGARAGNRKRRERFTPW